MANRQDGFYPRYGTGSIESVTDSSASETIETQTESLCLTNLGATVCYVRTGVSSATATTADYPVPGYAQVVIRINPDHDTVAYITASGTTSLHIMVGSGV